MKSTNQDKFLWQPHVGNDGRTALEIPAGTEGLLNQQEVAQLVPQLDPINWPSTPSGGEGEV